MAKKEDPFMLEHYRFLSPQKQEYINTFLKKLDDVCREFAVKRYVEGKTINQIAEEIGYTERAVYAYRDRIISLWYVYSEQEKLNHHRQRLLNILKKHGIMKHRRLMWNFNLKRSGLTNREFKDIIEQLILSGKIISFHSVPGEKGGRCGNIYKLN